VAAGLSSTGLEQKVDRLIEQMAELGRQNAALIAEVQELRRENERLRRELDAAGGRRVHEPYTGASGEIPAVSSVTGGGVGSVLRSTTPPRDNDGDMMMDLNSPPPKQDLKRAKAAAEDLHPNV
jgi:serine phosphatase RsbU (regulator of sigma subunit)